jgi:hypothetical protein
MRRPHFILLAMGCLPPWHAFSNSEEALARVYSLQADQQAGKHAGLFGQVEMSWAQVHLKVWMSTYVWACSWVHICADNWSHCTVCAV